MAAPLDEHRMTHRVAGSLAVAAGLLVPLGLSAAWIPIRTRLPNTDLALLLVLVVLVIGALGSRFAVIGSAVSGALWFEFFDTRPFEQLAIQRRPDVETTLVLAFVALVGGELAVRTVRHRASARSEAARFASISGAASLLASGEELVLVIQAIAGELSRLLGLRDCCFEVAPPDASRARVERNGDLVVGRRVVDPARSGLPGTLELPVWGHRKVFGHYVLELPPGPHLPNREMLLVAVTLADQVGAAFMTQAPPPPDPADQPTPNLHVVR